MMAGVAPALPDPRRSASGSSAAPAPPLPWPEPAPGPERLDVAGRTVLVLGLGRWSGGVEAARFLCGLGARVLVSDSGDPTSLAASAAAVSERGATVVFGPQTPSLLDGLRPDRGDFVVASPAIPFDHPVLLAAGPRGIAVTTEIALFCARVRAPVLAVTGTKGKSTTATLLGAMVRAALAPQGRRAFVGGNVGRSLLADLDGIEPDDAVVLELSSFQLYWLARLAFAPRVAVVTNLFPDHLDRHGDLAHYAACKRAVLSAQGPDDVAVLPADDPALASHGFYEAGRARRVFYAADARATPFADRRPDDVGVASDGSLVDGEGRPVASLARFALLGRHNRGNAAAAAAAARAFGAGAAAVEAGAAGVEPLPHRLQPVHAAGDLVFVDDSIATTPQSTRAALEAIPRRCVVLLGGKAKGVEADAAAFAMATLLPALRAHARGVVGIGSTGAALVAQAASCGLPAVLAGGGPDLVGAVRAAVALARPGDAVLLSPGFSSLDQYASFAERGDAFAAAARALAR